jgi:hypothetical protein
MTDDRKSGIALIAGSLGGVFTMAIHPTGTASLPSDQAAHLAFTSGLAHSLAVVSFVLLFLGACGLVLRITAADRLAFAALVVFGVACVAVLIATAVSGFIVPSIMRQMIRDVPTAAAQWRIVISGIFQINQAFSKIFSVAASVSIILWSISALRSGGLGRRVAIYGCITAPLVILGIATGHLRLDVHGMTAIVLAHTIWFIAVGAQLCSQQANSPGRS